MKKYKVYKITCKINNKIYVGQTYETLEERFKRHISFSKTKIDTKFYRAIRKHGAENFYIELLEDCDTQEELDELEYKWIVKLNAVKEGYNTKNSIGKCGGDTLSNHPNIVEIKQKISNSKKGALNPNHSEVKALNLITKEEIHFKCVKEAQNYFKIERHDVISKRCRKIIRIPWNNWVFAYENDEYLLNYSPVYCCKIKIIDTIENSEQEFASYSEAEKYYNFPKGSIGKKLRSLKPDTLYKNRYKIMKL